MLKQGNHKGFTIIEVVITIAIGAAVMALVLNAVAGARRSQRNNARTSDVNHLSAAINEYIASRNKLPEKWSEVSTIVGTSTFGHYSAGVTSIAPEKKWTSAIPANGGDFPDFGATATAATTTTGFFAFDAEKNAPDWVFAFRKAKCDDAAPATPKAGGLRDMIVVYRLEGQNTPLCLDI